MGSYKGNKSKVFITVKEDKIRIYNSDKEEIAVHNISLGKGIFVRNTSHRRAKSTTIDQMRKKALKFLLNSKEALLFLELLQKDKSRYFRDNLQVLLKCEDLFSEEIIKESLIFCIENKLFNTSVLLEVMRKKLSEKTKEEQAERAILAISNSTFEPLETKNPVPQKSNIAHYEKIMSHE